MRFDDDVKRRVAITGMGAVTPLGTGASVLFERWAAGDVGLKDGVGRCESFDPTAVLSVKEARRSDRFTQFAIAAADEACTQAGWSGGLPYDPDRIGCVFGTAFGGLGTTEEQRDVLREKGPSRVSPLMGLMMMPNAGAGAVAIRYGLKGPSCCVASACAAGTDAIGAAVRIIRAGEAEAMVAGGAEASLTELGLAAGRKMGALSECGISRPFDARRDGLVMGEGAGALILEDYDLAVSRGAEVLGEVLGYGASSDAYHLTEPDPTGDGAARAIRLALQDADVAPEELAYVNAHGTSTPLNDRMETDALKSALGDAAFSVPVSSTKSVVGHLVGGAGAAEAVATLLALRAGVAPPTVGYEQPDEGLDLDYVPGTARRLAEGDGIGNGRALIALSNSFGFGGHNGVLCLSAP